MSLFDILDFERNARVRTAALALAHKLEAVHGDAAYRSVWAMNQSLGGPYTGPSYQPELAALRAALDLPPERTK